jgi:putative flavoprotein involved in K+ transport
MSTRHGLIARRSGSARACPIRPASPRRSRLDLAAEGINAVIWATGYGVDFGWIDSRVRCHGRADPPQRHH